MDQLQIFEDQASWFLSLPNKIKRHHFSREEQVILTDRCEKALLDQSCGHTTVPLRPTGTTNDERCHSVLLAQQIFTSTSAAFNDTLKAMIVAVEDSWHWKPRENKEMPEPGSHDLSRYSATSTESLLSLPRTPCSAIIHPVKRSFRRSFSLTPLPLAAPTLVPLSSAISACKSSVALSPGA